MLNLVIQMIYLDIVHNRIYDNGYIVWNKKFELHFKLVILISMII